MSRKIAILALAALAFTFAHPAQAQKSGKVYRIGYLSPTTAIAYRNHVTVFRQEMRKLGYAEGKNLVIEEYYAAGDPKRRRKMAEEMVHLNYDLLLHHGMSAVKIAVRAMKKAGRMIPIVFSGGVNPVGQGIVASLARPGGNITGVTDFHGDLVSKRLELIKEIVPQVSRIGVIFHTRRKGQLFRLKTVREAASALGVTLVHQEIKREPDSIARALAALKKEGVEALVIIGHPYFSARAKKIADLAIKYRLPSTFVISKYPKAGGLMSHGANFSDMYRRAAHHVDNILKGAKPADLPVERPRELDLVINLKTAKALGITIPPEVLLRATKVIK